MADPLLAPETLIWTDALRAGAVAGVLARMGPAVRVIGVGGPRSAEVGELARRLDCPPADDLRQLLVDRPAAFLLLASGAEIAPADLHLALGQGTVVLALEPAAASLDGLAEPKPIPAAPGSGGGGAPRPGWVARLPAFARSPGWVHAAEPAEVLGTPRTILFTSHGPPAAYSLFARLLDAWHVVLEFAGLPDGIDAALLGPSPGAGAGAGAGPGAAVPDSLRDLTGHLTAHARLPDGRAALVQASDHAGRSARRLVVLGDGGELEIGDLDYALRDAAGSVIDSHAAPPDPATFTDLIAQQWAALLDRRSAPPTLLGAAASAERDAAALACCLACLLSSRTRQPESPRQALAMQRGTRRRE